jgi:ribonuclease J
VLSSRIIPGNEKAIYRVIDHLYRREAHVIYEGDGAGPPIHVSGHASQEELRLVINLVRPRYFIPLHGEYRQLKRHAELAQSMRGAVGQPIMIESGDILEFDELGARKAGKINVGRICIDSGGSMGDIVEDLVIKDRRHLSEDGIVLPIVAINKLTGEVESTEIVSRGFAVATDNGDFGTEARELISQTISSSSHEEMSDYGVMKEKIRADLKRHIVKNTQRRPLILPVILEI